MQAATTMSMLSPPIHSARWFYAFQGGWQAFSDEDDAALERRWKQLDSDGSLERCEEERRKEEEQADDISQNDTDGQEKDGMARVLPSASTPSGVDQLRRGVVGAAGKGDAAKGDGVKAEPGKQVVNEHLDPDEPESNRRMRVEVMEDHLFEVDLAKMNLFPVFWKGVLLKVVRANWFYASRDTGGYAPIPYNEGLSRDLDAAYAKVKPWTREFAEESDDEGCDADNDDELCELPSMGNKGQVHFQGPTTARIFTQDLTGRFMSVLGGSLVVRGWDETARRSKAGAGSLFQQSFLPWAGGSEESGGGGDEGRGDSRRAQHMEGAAKAPSKAPASASSSTQDKGGKEEGSQGGMLRLWPSSESFLRPGVTLLRALGWSKEDAAEEGQRAAKQKNTESSLKNDGKEGQDGKGTENVPDDRKDDPPELVLAIHGIGQKMVEEWDAIDFVYDVEKLRNLSKKVAGNAPIQQVSRGKRAQFLPICWRRDISFDDEEAKDGNDNIYTLRDVSNEASIPIVRNVISKVILDVPYYLSRHKAKMIEAVKAELNRVYRLFVRRNPHFEEQGGRVSLICHSLGSAIAADLLSNQPTLVAPLSKRSPEELRSNAHLLFNVKNLFFIGSPNGFFFHLEGAQLIARRGTARTHNVAEDAAKEEVGRYGCMAAEAVYNCYNTTDPVAFQLSATVDAPYARILRPISIPDAVPALLDALSQPRLSLSKLFDPSHPFSKRGNPAYTMQTGKSPDATSGPPSGVNTPKRKIRGEVKSPIMVEQGSAQKHGQIKALLREEEEQQQRAPDGRGTDDAAPPHFDLKQLQRAERR